MTRPITHRYRDPVELIWLRCAAQLGLRVERSEQVFAHYDGAGTLWLSSDAHLDPDDSLAQLIFHELCHALVAGPGGLTRPDFGLENTDDRDLIAEHACHRLQAALADEVGLRGFMAVTTDHRPYWDALPVDPLGPADDPAVPLAREAYRRAQREPWASALGRALSATAAIARVLDLPPADDSLWATARPLHVSGFPVGDASGHCADCAWAYQDAGALRCRQTRRAGREPAPVGADEPACVRYEPRLDGDACARCGACCREGFHRVELASDDLVQLRHPSLVSRDGWGAHLARPGGRCVALEGDGQRDPFRCRVYLDRPRDCRELQVGGDACLEARRRVGLSP